MPIEFKCPNCGTPLTAPDTAAGSSGPCPRCKARVTAPASVFTQAAEPALDTSDMSLTIDLGSVTSACGKLLFRLKIEGDGRATCRSSPSAPTTCTSQVSSFARRRRLRRPEARLARLTPLSRRSACGPDRGMIA